LFTWFQQATHKQNITVGNVGDFDTELTRFNWFSTNVIFTAARNSTGKMFTAYNTLKTPNLTPPPERRQSTWNAHLFITEWRHKEVLAWHQTHTGPSRLGETPL